MRRDTFTTSGLITPTSSTPVDGPESSAMSENAAELMFLVLSSEYVKGSYLRNQCTPEMARLLSLEPAFDWRLVTELDLSRINVVHLLGLDAATNVRRLRLAHNHIGRIENLDRLTRLEDLDLSLNRIAVIENLDALTELKSLNVGGNRIVRLENMDANGQLDTFIACDNRIADVRQVRSFGPGALSPFWPFRTWGSTAFEIRDDTDISSFIRYTCLGTVDSAAK